MNVIEEIISNHPLVILIVGVIIMLFLFFILPEPEIGSFEGVDLW